MGWAIISVCSPHLDTPQCQSFVTWYISCITGLHFASIFCIGSPFIQSTSCRRLFLMFFFNYHLPMCIYTRRRCSTDPFISAWRLSFLIGAGITELSGISPLCKPANNGSYGLPFGSSVHSYDNSIFLLLFWISWPTTKVLSLSIIIKYTLFHNRKPSRCEILHVELEFR